MRQIIFAANVALSAALIYFSGALSAETISISWTFTLLVTFVVHSFLMGVARNSLGYFLLGFLPVLLIAPHRLFISGAILGWFFVLPPVLGLLEWLWRWSGLGGSQPEDE